MRLPLLIFGAATLASVTFGANGESAMEALQLLPENHARNLSHLEGRPDEDGEIRWYLDVFDPSAPRGVHQFVVAGGAIVADRMISQFSPSLTAADVIGRDTIRTDSNILFDLANRHSQGELRRSSVFVYQLSKGNEDARPQWRVQKLDEDGDEIGHLLVDAESGIVISQGGFEDKPTRAKKKKQRLTTFADAEVARDRATPSPVRARRRAESDEEQRPSGVGRAFRKVGGSLQRFFTGRDTINR